MKRPRHIERDGYHVLDWHGALDFFIDDLWQRFPELVVGRYLVNTSYDSGFLTLSESARRDGWHMVGRHAHSPRIRSPDQIPHDQYDEWLVFDQPVQIEEFETMVNYCGFTPVDFGWVEKRERFWEQVAHLRPLHVIAENDGVYLLSKDEDLIRRITNAEPAWLHRPGRERRGCNPIVRSVGFATTMQSLEQIEGTWPEPGFCSGLLLRCHAARKKPIDQLSDLELATLLNQDVGVAHILPEAVRRLRCNQPDDSEYFDGQLKEAVEKNKTR